jgi:hypothetical protein
MKTYIFIAGLLLTLTLSIGALADFTVNKTMSEAFQMWNSDGSPRTDCDLSKFTVRSWRNGTSIVQSWSFRNQSTGDYTATRVPNAPGFHKMIYYYNNTAIMTATENVRLYDIDTNYSAEAKDATVAKATGFAHMSSIIKDNSGGGTVDLTSIKHVLNGMSSIMNRPHAPGGF